MIGQVKINIVALSHSLYNYAFLDLTTQCESPTGERTLNKQLKY